MIFETVVKYPRRLPLFFFGSNKMGSGPSNERKRQAALDLRTRRAAATSANLTELTFALISAIETLESKTGDRCTSLRNIGAMIQTIAAEAQKGQDPDTKEMIQLLKKMADKVLKKLGQICCDSPETAEDCAQVVSSLVRMTHQLIAIFQADAAEPPVVYGA